jgi:hypothetical protein
MPGGPWSDQQHPLLSGLFGTFQTAAQDKVNTSELWTALRQAAGNWWYQSNGLKVPTDPAVLESTGASVLHSQGVSAGNVSVYRGIAGVWLQSKKNLHELDWNDQITGECIFVPPWAKTAG